MKSTYILLTREIFLFESNIIVVKYSRMVSEELDKIFGALFTYFYWSSRQHKDTHAVEFFAFPSPFGFCSLE